MKTFLTIKFALVPFAVLFALLSQGMPGYAFAAGLVLTGLLEFWRFLRREVFILEIGTLALLASLSFAYLGAPAFVAANATWMCFMGLGLIGLVGLALRRPWTSDYSRAAYPDSAGTPQFFLINVALSGLWSVLFLALGALRYFETPGYVATAIILVGALLSIIGPRMAISAVIKQMRAARETYHWPPPKLDRKSGDCDVAIVGAGIGGLTAAAFLADAGYRVAVFDQHVLPGGYCHHYWRKARYRGEPILYRFDAGPHDFSGVWEGGPIAGLLNRLGVANRIEWRRVDHSYRMEQERIDPPRDWREYAAMLANRFPGSATGIVAFFDDVHAIFEDMYSTGAERCNIPSLPASATALLAFPTEHPHAFKWMRRRFDELVTTHVSDPRVVSIIHSLAGYLHDGSETPTCAQMVPIFGYYFKGGHYPVGGSGRFSEVLVEAIEERGGAVHLKTPVRKIIVENGAAVGVELGDGRIIRAKAVVSNADIKRTFLELVDPANTPADFRARLASAPPANSAFTVQVGIDFVPDIKPATHVEGDMQVGIAAMSLVDPSAAPPGHSILNLIRLIPNEKAKNWFPPEGGANWKKWRASREYERQKQELGDDMIAAAETILPGLRDHIVYRTDASPVTYARYDWASTGSIYGISAKGRLKGSKSPVKNLAIAGAGNMGAGVEAAVISGAEAAEALVPGVLARSPQDAGNPTSNARRTAQAA